jgi:hypothetical protein
MSLRDTLTGILSSDKKNIDAWVQLLSLEYTECAGSVSNLRKLIPKFSAAVSSVGVEARRSPLFAQLQVDEVRVVMQCDPPKARTLFKAAKASTVQKENWDFWRLYIIYEALQGKPALLSALCILHINRKRAILVDLYACVFIYSHDPSSPLHYYTCRGARISAQASGCVQGYVWRSILAAIGIIFNV